MKLFVLHITKSKYPKYIKKNFKLNHLKMGKYFIDTSQKQAI